MELDLPDSRLRNRASAFAAPFVERAGRFAAREIVRRARQYKFASGKTKSSLATKIGVEKTPVYPAGKRRAPPIGVNPKRLQMGRRRVVSLPAAHTGSGYTKFVRKRVNAYQLKGHVVTHEVSGTNSMLNTCYTGVSHANLFQIGYTIGVSFLRYIMWKWHGISYTSEDDSIIPGYTNMDANIYPLTQSLPHSIAFSASILGNVVTDPYGVAAIYQIQYPTGATAVPTTIPLVRQFGAWFAENVFTSTAFGFGVQSAGAGTMGAPFLHRMALLYPNANGNSTVSDPAWFVDHDTDISRLRVSCYCISNLILQNSTTADAATGDVYNTDRIDSNPLVGRLYNLRGGVPAQRIPTYVTNNTATAIWNELSQNTQRGMIMPSTNPPESFRVPPEASAFIGCKGYRNVSLQPGESKSFSFKWKFTGYLNTLMRYLAPGGVVDSTGANTQPNRVWPEMFVKGLNRCTLIALEKRIKGEPGVPVVVNYHLDQYVGGRVLPLTGNVIRTGVNLYDDQNNAPA